MAERLSAMNVRDVQLDYPSSRSGDGVMQRDAGVGVRRGVQDDTDRLTVCLSSAGLLDPVDKLALAVGLTELQIPTQLVRDLEAGALDIGQGCRAVDLWLAHPQQIQIRAVQDVRGCHGGTPSQLRASEIAHRRS